MVLLDRTCMYFSYKLVNAKTIHAVFKRTGIGSVKG